MDCGLALDRHSFIHPKSIHTYIQTRVHKEIANTEEQTAIDRICCNCDFSEGGPLCTYNCLRACVWIYVSFHIRYSVEELRQ